MTTGLRLLAWGLLLSFSLLGYDAESRGATITLNLDPHLASLDRNAGTHAIFFPDFGLQIRGWVDDAPDPDMTGVSLALSAADPLGGSSFSIFGVGNIAVLDGVMESIKFRYGVRGNVHQNPVTGQVAGGFTGSVRSAYYGRATARSGTDTTGDFTNSGGVHYQFAASAGSPAGPVELAPQFSRISTGQVGTTFNNFSWTTGSAIGTPTQPTRPGKSQIGDIEIKVIPAKDILKGAVTRRMDSRPERMGLVFQPQLSVSMVDLAEALGVDHFNWFQQVVGGPKGWALPEAHTSTNGFTTETIASSELDAAVDSLLAANNKSAVGIVDPLPQVLAQEARYSIVSDVPNGAGGHFRQAFTQDWVDDKLPYYNETVAPFYRGAVPGETPAVWDIKNATDVGLDTLYFFDSPHSDLIDPTDKGDVFKFRTELIGVRPDGTIRFLADEFPGLGLAWNWETNTKVARGGPAGAAFGSSR